jgi:hypothetical protein
MVRNNAFLLLSFTSAAKSITEDFIMYHTWRDLYSMNTVCSDIQLNHDKIKSPPSWE